MKALISPNESVKYISEWTATDIVGQYLPVYSDIPNGQRIPEVSENQFDVAGPLFWVDCGDNVVADQYYYDTSDSTIKLISDLESPYPSE
jgi:hypothetical protein